MKVITTTTTVNLNDIVRCKLTERGLQQYREHYARYSPASLLVTHPEFCQPTITEDGYTILPLWSFMHIFGVYMQMGEPPQTEDNNIIIEQTEYKEVTA